MHLELSVWIGAAPAGPKPNPKKQGTLKASRAMEEQQIIDDNSNAKGNVASPEHRAQCVPKQAASEAQDDSSSKEAVNCAYGAWNCPINWFTLVPIPTKCAKQLYIQESDEDQHISITKGEEALFETDNEEERSSM